MVLKNINKKRRMLLRTYNSHSYVKIFLLKTFVLEYNKF